MLTTLGPFLAPSVPCWALLGLFWTLLWLFWALLGLFWALLDPSYGMKSPFEKIQHFVHSFGQRDKEIVIYLCWTLLGTSGIFLALLGPLGSFWCFLV